MAEQPSFENLPYYREYLDHILRPRVVRLIEEVRSNLAAHAWNELLERMAEEQNPGGSTDPVVIQKMRVLLEKTLGLHLGVQMQAEFSDGPVVRPSQNGVSEQGRRPDQIEVVDRSFPDNPLARAVGGMRRPAR